jgi:hypothetical protein
MTAYIRLCLVRDSKGVLHLQAILDGIAGLFPSFVVGELVR